MPQDRRVTTSLLWLLVLSCAAFWGWTIWFGRWPWTLPPAALPAATAQALPVLRSPAELAQLLGAKEQAAPAAPGPAQRFLVWGVIAGASGGGAALISVDGQAPKPFAVGTELAPGWVLRSLGTREVRLAASANAPVSLTLPLPPPELPPPGAAPPAAAPSASFGPTPAASAGSTVQPVPAAPATTSTAPETAPGPPVGLRSSRAPSPTSPP